MGKAGTIWDRRTTAFRYGVVPGASAAAGFAAPYVYKGLHSLQSLPGTAAKAAFNYFKMPAVSRRSTPYGFGSRRRYRKRGRRAAAKRRAGRRLKRRSGGFRGTRAIDRKIRLYRGLNTNFSRNDYDSVRDVYYHSTNVYAETAGPGQFRRSIKLGNFPLVLQKFLDYNEYKITSVQYVLEPTFGQSQLDACEGVDPTDNQGPYVYVWMNKSNVSPISSPTQRVLAVTPGMRKISVTSRRRFVWNAMPFYEIDRDTEQGVGLGKYMKRMGWIENKDTASYNAANHPEVCPTTLFVPQLAGSSPDLNWKITTYATFLFRGYRVLPEDQ